MKKLLLLSVLSFFIPVCFASEEPYEIKPIVFTAGVEYDYDVNWKDKTNTGSYYIPAMNVVEDSDYDYVNFITYRFGKRMKIIKESKTKCDRKYWYLCFLDK